VCHPKQQEIKEILQEPELYRQPEGNISIKITQNRGKKEKSAREIITKQQPERKKALTKIFLTIQYTYIYIN